MTPSVSLIPRRLLQGNPSRLQAQISPDGRTISFLAPLEGVLNLWLAPVEAPEQARALTHDRQRAIRQYGWTPSGHQLWYLQDQGGNEDFQFHVVDLDQGQVRNLTPFPGTQTRLIGLSRRHPEQALIAINRRDRRWHDVYRLDLRGGELALVHENNRYALFLADDELRLRLAAKAGADGSMEVHVPDGAGHWRPLFQVGAEDVVTTKALALGPASESLAYFLDSRGRDTAAAVAIDLVSGERSLLGEHPSADILELLINPISLRPEACRSDHLAPEWQMIGTSLHEDFARLAAQAGGGDFQILSRSADDGRWIVAFSSDTQPGQYALYERDSGRIRPLFVARPELEGWPLAPMRALSLRARDGLPLVSYLTLPADTALDAAGRPREPLPMVLLVHGGPWARYHYGYNAEHQFYASRGYAVLAVNFRGSTGFGKAFVNAGNHEWGGKMHDDLVDAAHWAVGAGIAQRERIAIMGGSYGGYATLVGLSFTPELFACGIDIVGPSNLETLLGCFPPYWAAIFEQFALRTGDPRTEEGRRLLRERSPLHRADAIRKPLLIAQGANDVRVTRQESDQIVAAMKGNDQPVTYVLYPDEGHGFGRAENRLSFMALTEAFLARFLGGACEPLGDALDGSSLQVLEGAEWIPGLGGARQA